MFIKFLLAAAMWVTLSATNTFGQEFPKNIMTGGAKGTYIQIGRDLAKISTECGFSLAVNESAGSLENLVSVKKRRHTQFGIVQNDVLSYVRAYANNDPDLQASLQGVRIMYPLYNEEVQVLASRKITRLSDLAGKKVAIGKTDSGTFLTATLILDILRINNAERIAVGSSQALPMLLNGELDAVFYVAGAPTKLFSDTAIDGAKFHLVDILEPELLATYTATEIAGGTYPFQPEPASVIAVKAVLMTYNYNSSKNNYHRKSCKAVSDLSSAILTNLERLREIGHPKWRDIDLSQLPPDWKVGDCVKVGMAAGYKLSCDASIGIFNNDSETDDAYLKLLKLRLKN